MHRTTVGVMISRTRTCSSHAKQHGKLLWDSLHSGNQGRQMRSTLSRLPSLDTLINDYSDRDILQFVPTSLSAIPEFSRTAIDFVELLPASLKICRPAWFGFSRSTMTRPDKVCHRSFLKEQHCRVCSLLSVASL